MCQKSPFNIQHITYKKMKTDLYKLQEVASINIFSGLKNKHKYLQLKRPRFGISASNHRN